MLQSHLPRVVVWCGVGCEWWGKRGGVSWRGVAWRFDISSIKQLSSFDRISFPQNSSL